MVLENVRKGSHYIIYLNVCNQEKTYSGLENQGRPAVLGDDFTHNVKVSLSLMFSVVMSALAKVALSNTVVPHRTTQNTW